MSRERFCPRLRKYRRIFQSAVFVKHNCLDIKPNIPALNSCQGILPHLTCRYKEGRTLLTTSLNFQAVAKLKSTVLDLFNRC